MDVLMLGDAAFTGENLKKGLEKKGHIVLHDTFLSWNNLFKKKYNEQHFDIVHIHSPNLKKLLIARKHLKNSKLVCHWHGSDLRHPIKAFPVYNYFKKHSDFNLYSTLDLRWWLRDISDDKKMLFTCPVDTDLFKSNGNRKQGNICFNGGGRSFKVHKIPHKDMPDYLNKYRIVDVINADGLDDGLLSVIAMEAVSCGCIVPQIPWLNREWVLSNANIQDQTEKLLEIYKRLLK